MAAELSVLRRGDAEYPARLADLAAPPDELTIGGSFQPRRAVAVVGTRRPSADAVSFTRELAAAIVEHGAVVVSGGALGIDAAAHEGALAAGGVTWVVAATGADEAFPAENAGLFARVAERGSAMIWPFERSRKADPTTFFARNGVLVALSEAVVIVQAGVPSGALNAAMWARRLGRPVWAVCAPPWVPGFLGCASVVELGARPLVSVGAWLRAAGLAKGRRKTLALRGSPAKRVPDAGDSVVKDGHIATRLTPEERSVVENLSPTKARHIDEIAEKSRLSAQAVATALLTLALENVVVEGPEGLFRLATTR